MTFNAASRLRSLEDRSAALGSRRCELPGMHSVPTSAVLPYASGVGGLSRRLLIYILRTLYKTMGAGVKTLYIELSKPSIRTLQSVLTMARMGGCQNSGPVWVPYSIIRATWQLGEPKGDNHFDNYPYYESASISTCTSPLIWTPPKGP